MRIYESLLKTSVCAVVSGFYVNILSMCKYWIRMHKVVNKMKRALTLILTTKLARFVWLSLKQSEDHTMGNERGSHYG